MPAPIVYAISPNRVPAAGGRVVQVVGRNLDVTVSATVGGNPVTGPNLVSTFLSQFTAAAHAAGPADLVVNNSSGSVTVTGGIVYV
jgi:hypothetical protein